MKSRQRNLTLFFSRFLKMNSAKTAPIALVVFAFAAVYILWGTTYLAIVIGLETIPPFLMAALRFAVAAVFLFGICIFRKDEIFSRVLYKNLLPGVVILTGGQGLLFWSEQYISSGTAAILVSSLPLWYVLLDRKNWKTYAANKLVMAGLFLGFAGIIIMFQRYLNWPEGSGTMQMLGIVAVLMAGICWALGTLWTKNHGNEYSIFANVGWQLVGGLLSCLVVAFCSGELSHFSVSSVSLRSVLATLYLALIGSVIAFVAFHWLMTVRPPAVVGTYAYVNPVIAVLLGWLVADEQITLDQIAGMIVILVSAFLVNSPKYFRRQQVIPEDKY